MEKAAGRRVYQRKGQKAALGEREKRRLAQLATCLILFLTVFFAKGADRLGGLRQELTTVLQTNMDLNAVLASLSRSITSGQSATEVFSALLDDLDPAKVSQSAAAGRQGPIYQAALQSLRQSDSMITLAATDLSQEETPPDPMASSGARDTAIDSTATEAEPAVTYVSYTGPALPDNTSMDRYALGLSETVSPVSAALTSGFGWREHPIEGGEKFHYGVDLGVESGTAVLAFSSGVVDYIGESDVYGKYLQLRHENGVTSFYAHCSRLCVQQGQTVAIGEKIAESGATGRVTGPHLHFELKKDGVRLNPIYYIQTLS
jgi:murein DD-endopeptidase MepM/ murein hydrolase activator NlpD